MKVLDLFSGIGGFSLGLERAGFETVAFCEIDPFCRKVLKKHWPDVVIHEDIKELDGRKYRGAVDVICGGFPCQDISVAGNQAGIKEGSRSGLWSECARLLREVRPRYAIFENVTNLLNGGGGDWFKRVLWDISKVGYDAEWHCVPASSLGANHRRDRVWIIAYANGERLRKQSRRSGRKKRKGTLLTELYGEKGLIAYANKNRLNKGRESIASHWSHGAFGDDGRQIKPTVYRVDDGVPKGSHKNRLAALGNAVIPQMPELIGWAIMKKEAA